MTHTVLYYSRIKQIKDYFGHTVYRKLIVMIWCNIIKILYYQHWFKNLASIDILTGCLNQFYMKQTVFVYVYYILSVQYYRNIYR